MPSLDPIGLVEVNPGPPSSFYIAFIVVFVAAGIGGGFAFYFRHSLFPRNSLAIAVAMRFFRMLTIIGVVGLILLAGRYLAIPYLSMRLWLLCDLAALVVLVLYTAYFYWRTYPKAAAAFRADEARRRYMQPPSPGGGGGKRRRSKKRR